jgi:hypothetical protein
MNEAEAIANALLVLVDAPGVPGVILAENLRGELLKAMEELPEEEKAAYAIAAKKCPELIDSESDPQRYVAHKEGNAQEAAQLLAKHWTLRLDLFGSERAFLSLQDLSGNGALTEEDIKLLRLGGFAILPNDTKGRTVLLVNQDRNTWATEPLFETSRIRCFFYTLSHVSDRGRPVVWLRCGGGGGGNPQQSRSDKVQEVLQSFPFTLEERHVLFLPPPGAMRTYEKTVAPFFARQIDGTQVHLRDSPREMLDDLIKLGFEKASLPPCVGGTWSYDNYTQWLDAQRPGQRVTLGEKRTLTVQENAQNDKSNQLLRAGGPALPGDRVLKAMVELPEKDKAAYHQAVDKCPQLIRSETDPHRYLKHANWEPLVAAKCLALHWKLRLEFFGKERAFLPLKDLSSNAALNQDDIKVLKSGYFTPLPNDTQGRTVLFVNGLLAGAPLDVDEASRARCFFYQLQIAAEMGRPFVLICFGIEKENQAQSRDGYTIMECFPIEFVGFYGLFMPPPGAGRVFKEKMILVFLQHLGENFRSVAHTVVSESPQDMIHELIQLGFETQALPECVGGTWSRDKLIKWSDSALPQDGVKGKRDKAALDERQRHQTDKTDHSNNQVNKMESAAMALAHPHFDYKVVLYLNNLAISMMKAGCYEQAYATLKNAADVSKILMLDLEGASAHIKAKLNQSIQRLSTPVRSPRTLPLSVITHTQATALSNMPNLMIQIDDTQHEDLIDNDDLMDEDDSDEDVEPPNVPQLLMSIVFYNHAIASRFLDQAAQENHHADRYLALSLRMACTCYEDCLSEKVIQRATAIAALVLLTLQKGDYDDSVLREIRKSGYELVSCLDSA